MTLEFSSFKEKWAFLKHHKVYVGLSGGVDSIVLLRLFFLCGFDVEALHVNYQLRGSESDADEDFVRELCHQLKVPIHIKKVETLKLISTNGGNLQEIARNIRYDFFQSFLDKNQLAYIAIAHQKDDQVETFFLNIARKSGLRGLACMLEKDKSKIRPLLYFSKQEIIHFAQEKNWDWREDSSNASLKYSRNILRNRYIPEMLKQVSNLQESVITLVEFFQRELKNVQDSIFCLSENIVSKGFLSKEDFRLLSKNQQYELLFKLGLNSAEIFSFYSLLDAQKGKRISTKKIGDIFKEKDGFSFEYYFPSVEMTINTSYTDTLPSIFTKNEFYFDADLIRGEIRLRSWKQNDRIKPLGIKGSKLISDVLNDAKLMSVERFKWPVLVDDEQVLACPYHAVSRTKIATNNSNKIICVKVQKNDLA